MANKLSDPLDPLVTLNTRINLNRRNALQAYASKHDIALTDAVKAAVDALLREEKGEDDGT